MLRSPSLPPFPRGRRAADVHLCRPQALLGRVAPGSLVTVPFRARQFSGIVASLADSTPLRELKSIESLLDPQRGGRSTDRAGALDGARVPAPLAGCLHLFLPPGITVHSDMHYALAPPMRRCRSSPTCRLKSSRSCGSVRRRAEGRSSTLSGAAIAQRGEAARPARHPHGDAGSAASLVRPRRVQYVRATSGVPSGPLSRQAAAAVRRAAALDYLRRQASRCG